MPPAISSHSVTARPGFDLKTVSVKMDEAYSPYIQATITIVMPDEATLATLNPRNRTRIVLEFGQEYGTSQPVSVLSAQFASQTVAAMSTAWNGKTLAQVSAPLYQAYTPGNTSLPTGRRFDLLIRKVVPNRAAGTVGLFLSSDESLLQDYRLLAFAPEAPGSTSVKLIVGNVLQRIGATLGTDAMDGSVSDASTPWTPGQTAWDYLEPILNAVGMRLWCDEARIWRLTNTRAYQGPTRALPVLVPLASTTDTTDRDGDWADAVVVKYSWNDANGAAQVAYDVSYRTTNGQVRRMDKQEPSGGLANAQWTKAAIYEYNSPPPASGASLRLAQYAIGRGQTLEVTSISDYNATPSIAVDVTGLAGDATTATITSVTFEYPADEMTIQTRDLAAAGVG